MTRTDTHRPSVLDPAEYTEVGSFDAHWEDGYEEIEPEFSNHEYSGNYSAAGRGKCDHCGTSIRYGVIFHHEPSDTLIAVGLTCAATVGLKSLSEKEIKAKAEHHRILKAIERWVEESPDNAAALAYFNEREQDDSEYRDLMELWNDLGCVGPAPRPRFRYNEFISDVARKLRRYGSLSENQVAAVLKCRDRDAEFAAKRDADKAALLKAPALTEGRYEITGEIVGFKYVEDRYSYDSNAEIKKMVVKLSDGNKVYGTVPESILSAEKGDTIIFSAKVERSKDDEHFGFFSRPTKARLS